MDPLNRQPYKDTAEQSRRRHNHLLLLLLVALLAFVGSRGFGPAMVILPALVMIPWMIGNSIYSVLALIVMTLVMGSEATVFWLMLNGGMMLWMGITMKQGQRDRLVYWGGVVMALVGMVSLLILANGGWHIDIRQMTTELLALQEASMKASGLSHQDIALTMDVLRTGANTLVMYMPAILILYGLMMPFLTKQLAGRVVKRGEQLMTYSRPFILFRLPSSLPWGTVLIFVVTFLFRQFMGDVSSPVFYNLFVIFSAVYLLNGMATLQFYLVKHGVGRFGRIMLGILILAIPITSGIMMIAGVADAWLNLRK